MGFKLWYDGKPALSLSREELEREYEGIWLLMEEHGHSLAFYEELYGASTALAWFLGISNQPPSFYYFDDLKEEERYVERE